MSRLGTISEIDKLAVTLALEPSALEFLDGISPHELRSLRVSIYERLFRLDAPVFERLAAVVTRLPARVVAPLAERVFGPLVAARVAAELPTADALAIARSVSVGFFADVCAYLDPRRTREMIEQLPPDRLVEIALELVARGEYMTMSRFIDFVSEEQTQAVIAAVEDEAAILRVAFYMGSKNRMDHLFGTLPRERVQRLVTRVQEEGKGLLTAFLSVLIHVSYAQKRELAELVAAQPPDILTGYIRATQDGELWPDVLGVVATMSPASQRAVVNLPILAEHDVQQAIVQTADDFADWGAVLQLLREMDDDNRGAVAAIVAGMPAASLRRAVDGALLGEHWELLLDLAGRMPAAKQKELGAIVGETIAPYDAELFARIAVRAAGLGIPIDQRTSESRAGVSASSAY